MSSSQNFVVDAQDRIREPIGMSGARLEAYAYIITGGTTAIQNLLNSIEKAGVPIVETLVAAASGCNACSRFKG